MLATTGCGDEVPIELPAVALTVAPSAVRLAPGDSVVLTATARPARAGAVRVEWLPGDTTVAALRAIGVDRSRAVMHARRVGATVVSAQASVDGKGAQVFTVPVDVRTTP